MGKPKPPSYMPIDREEEPGLYEMVDALIVSDHQDLVGARIALAWRYGQKPDADGRLSLGKCRKVNELDQRLLEFDFVIILNRDVWDDLDQAQKRALLDHELCHAAPKLDKDGEQVEDASGRKVWRIRKHDVEEFTEVIRRHGLYKRDLEDLGKAILRRKDAPLFADIEQPKQEAAEAAAS